MNTQDQAPMSQSIVNSNTCRILLATCFSALCLIALNAQAATITVTNTNDSGAGSLRQAIADAHDGDAVQVGVSGTITLATGELLVDKSIAIRGPGSDSLTVDGNLASRVFYVGSGVTATIAGLTVANGDVQFSGLPSGGGIYNDHATLSVDSCSVSSSYAGWGGGGVCNSGGTLTLTNSTVTGNWAAAPYSEGIGGGIYNEAGTLTVSNCTISGNGGLAYTPFGGGVYNANAGTMTITNSTLSGNSALYGGGGIYNDGTVTIGNSIFGNAGAGNIVSYFGVVLSDGYNLSSDDASGFLTATGDQINADPMLGPLQDNGGPTFTHGLLAGSPAIDAGDPNFTPPPNYDQRGAGFERVVNGRVDIGAFEVQPPTPSYLSQVQPPINPDGTSTFNVRRGVVSVKFNLTRGGVATCELPPATIAVTRTAGGVIEEVNESVYSGNADTASNFRIDNCEYAYNLNSRAIGAGTYRIDILIDGQVVGSAVFALN